MRLSERLTNILKLVKLLPSNVRASCSDLSLSRKQILRLNYTFFLFPPTSLLEMWGYTPYDRLLSYKNPPRGLEDIPT